MKLYFTLFFATVQPSVVSRVPVGLRGERLGSSSYSDKSNCHSLTLSALQILSVLDSVGP